jgi:hypothetical protein
MHWKRKKKPLFENYERKTYAQCGEDVIISFVLENIRIVNPYYVDIGAHHPWNISNTALFYNKGNDGILVEADPLLCQELEKERPRTKC